jgi:LmbE family N-acetylglucosaminyl deacetylase
MSALCTFLYVQTLISHPLSVSFMAPSVKASILVVVAHPDDECIGAGGTIKKHVDLGFETDVLCLTGNEVRNEELRAACNILGVREVYTNERDDFAIDWSLEQEIVSAILKSKPSIMITHSMKDYNRNHVRCSKLVADAVEWASHVTMHEDAVRVDRVYAMEINSLHSRPNVLVDVSDSFDAAMDALRRHGSQLQKADGFYLRFYDARTRLRGIQAACDRAEAFTVSFPYHAGPFYPRNAVDSLI